MSNPPPIDGDRAAPNYPIKVEYLGHLKIAVSGRYTGSLYRFSPRAPVQQIDPRDALYLLENRLFGIAQ